MSDMVETPALADSVHTLPLVVRFRPLFAMTPEEFFEFCRLNPDLNIELTAEGEVLFMSPSGSGTGARNAQIILALGQWASKDGTGVFFDSSAGFTLPNKAVRAPDASWVRRERWEALTLEQRERFAPLCPNFVVEVAYPSDYLADLQTKMDEYLANGAQLGWLIVPERRSVYVYRPSAEVQLLSDIDSISSDPVLPGFTLDLAAIW
jgi:Uma2 family endonuclease